jgi:TRAP-type C4-dicarboxylate transport system permease small subunit
LVKAISYSRLTTYIPEIPMWILYAPMIIGMAMMAITLIFMILDCMTDSDRYI